MGNRYFYLAGIVIFLVILIVTTMPWTIMQPYATSLCTWTGDTPKTKVCDCLGLDYNSRVPYISDGCLLHYCFGIVTNCSKCLDSKKYLELRKEWTIQIMAYNENGTEMTLDKEKIAELSYVPCE